MYLSVYLLLIRKMNCVFVAIDGDFDVVRLDEIMTIHYLELFFFKIHLLIFIFIDNFLFRL